ncbi:MAG: type I secretion system permease/ATPase [Pseudomonadota bacterium]
MDARTTDTTPVAVEPPTNRSMATANEPQGSNGLAEALVHVARHHGLGVSLSEVLRSGTGEARGLSLETLDRVADRLGLTIRIEKVAPARLSPLTLPAIVFDRGGSARVLGALDRRAKTARLIDPVSRDTSDASEPIPENIPLNRLRSDLAPIAVLVTPKPQVAASQGDGQAAARRGHWFWSAARRFWPAYLQVVIAAFLVNLLGLATPLFVMNVYDRVIPNLAIPTLWALTAGIVLALGFDFLLKILRARIVDDTGRRVDMAVAGRLFDHLLDLPLAHRPPSTGMLANQIREFETVRDLFTSSSLIAFTDLLFVGVFLWVMWLIVGPLALVPALAVPLVLIVTLLAQIPMAKAVRDSQMQTGRRHGVLIETATSLETVKASGGEAWLRRIWDQSVAGSSRSSAQARFWSLVTVSWTQFIHQAVSVVIIVWGVFLVIDGLISIGALIAANILAGRVLAPLGNISQTLVRMQQGRVAFRMLNGFMALPEDGQEFGMLTLLPNRPAVLTFDRVGFCYPGATRDALAEASFEIGSGERVAVVGKVGSGKTTLGRLASGLYVPASGSVRLDGLDIRQFAPSDIRGVVGYCPQDTELFTGTLADNIRIGAPLSSDADLARAADLAGVTAFAADHPLGLDMPVIERGRSLSGGQRQAVALARTLIRRPGIVILDEPSSSLDTASEKRLIDGLTATAEEGVTLILSTHRDALLTMVDRIIVLDQGRIVLDDRKDTVIKTLSSGGEQMAKANQHRDGHATA